MYIYIYIHIGGRLDLHLFEQRYRLMMQRVVNSTRSFAYVPSFNQYNFNATVGDVALVAVLEEVSLKQKIYSIKSLWLKWLLA
jgi:hypothetical protein